MNYHNITKCDMLNGDGLRVVLWVSGCPHKCKGCHNPQTWDANSGLPFTKKELDEIYAELEKPYISGITISGGDPLMDCNAEVICDLLYNISLNFPKKTIWLYTGYEMEDINKDDLKNVICRYCDVVVIGQFIEELADKSYPWCGSTNQKVIRRN